MHDKVNISFQHTDCPEEKTLLAYHNNALTKSEFRAVELHLADCEMCTDYLDGLSLLSGNEELKAEATFIMSEINKDRSKKNKLWFYAAAASVFLAISIFSVIWFIPVKNNFVAQEIMNDSKTNEDISEKKDSFDSNVNGLFKNSSEVVNGDMLKDNLEQQQERKTVDQTGKIEDTRNANIIEKNVEKADGFLSYNLPSPGESNKLKEGETKTETTSVIELSEETAKVSAATGETHNISGGTTAVVVSQDKAKNEKESKVDKKSNRGNARQKESLSVADEVLASEQAPATANKNELPAKDLNLDDLENRESNLDLDKAKVFFQQQMTDSAVVYALRASASCDSCKWSALLLLSKSYLFAGQTEKAVTTLKEVKAKGPSKYAKEAKLELERLGY